MNKSSVNAKFIFTLFIAHMTIGCATFNKTKNSDPQPSEPPTTRNFSTVIDDENIEIKTLKAIFDQDNLWKNSDIDIVSFNRVILLLGQAPTKSLKDKAGEIASTLDNVKQVYNEIRVAAPTSTITYLGDLAITTKVKASLFAENDFDSGKIKVVTEDSEVFLLGLVSNIDAKRAVEITRNVSGVKRVIQAFEIIETKIVN